jgi:uncharacterized protein
MGEALKRLRHLTPAGPKGSVNVDKTIYQTMRNAGEIEIVFDRRLKTGSSAAAHRQRRLVHGSLRGDGQALFHYARPSSRICAIYYFHNTITDRVWRDPQRSQPAGSNGRLLRPRSGDPPDHRRRRQHGP